MNSRTTERDLTVAERFLWGTCPVCDAVDGESCDEGQEAVHLGRLQAAPKRVRVLEVAL